MAWLHNEDHAQTIAHLRQFWAKEAPSFRNHFARKVMPLS